MTTVGTVIGNIVKPGNQIIRKGQKHAIQFTGVKIQVDGKTGPKPKK